MTRHMLRILRSPSTYPLTTFWAIATVILPLTAAGRIDLSTGVILLAATAIVLVLMAFRRDIAQVHVLVNSQHDDLVARVAQLIETLQTSGVPVPDDSAKKGP